MGLLHHLKTASALSAIAGTMATVGLIGSADAADFAMKFGFVTRGDQQNTWSNWYAEAVNKASNGRIAAKAFPGGQLGSIPRHVEGVQLGTIEATIFPADFFVGVDPRFGVFSIPSLFKNRAHAAKVLADPSVASEVQSLGGNKGMVGVGAFVHSTVHYFGKNPIRKLSDFKGKKMRVNATPAERERMKRLGATAIPLPLGELVPALQRGVVDGTMSGIGIYVNFKFQKLGTVLTQTDDTLLISTGLVSKKWLDGLPGDLRKIVLDEGKKVQARIIVESPKMEDGFTAKWKTVGGSIIRFSDAEQAKLLSTIKTVGEQVTKSNPQVSAFYKKLLAVGAKY